MRILVLFEENANFCLAVGPTEFLNRLLEFLVLVYFLMVHDLFRSSLTTYTREKYTWLTHFHTFKHEQMGRPIDVHYSLPSRYMQHPQKSSHTGPCSIQLR